MSSRCSSQNSHMQMLPVLSFGRLALLSFQTPFSCPHATPHNLVAPVNLCFLPVVEFGLSVIWLLARNSSLVALV